MSTPLRPSLLWSAVWLVLVAVALGTRPPLPVDETRYLAVAWEMWLGGDYLVPHLNGETYSHKPPLLFWLMNLGWAIFGVSAWWARLVAPLFGLGCLFLSAALARRLWPARPDLARRAPLILLGSVFWSVFTTLTMFDMVLAFFALAGLLGVARAWRQGGWAGWALFGLAMGCGLLAKGPAILVHTLPVALLAPLWAAGVPPGGWRRWYLGILAALLAAAALGLAWAVPAAVSGGAAYRDAILWGQTAGRMVDSFAHGQPWWWYAAMLPPLLLPWLLWPTLWRGLRGARAGLGDTGVRFCLAWLVPAFVVFSMISGKQLHYLLPDFPALALLVAFLVTGHGGGTAASRDQALPAAVFAVLCVGAFVLASGLTPMRLPPMADAVAAAWILAAAGVAVAAAVLPAMALEKRLVVLMGLAAVLVLAVHLAARPYLAGAFDLGPLAGRLAAWQAEGRPLAHYGKYHGQFQFLGRLTRPMAITGDKEVVAWATQNPTGKIVTYQRHIPPGGKPDFVQPFRSLLITVWDAALVKNNPLLVKRP